MEMYTRFDKIKLLSPAICLWLAFVLPGGFAYALHYSYSYDADAGEAFYYEDVPHPAGESADYEYFIFDPPDVPLIAAIPGFAPFDTHIRTPLGGIALGETSWALANLILVMAGGVLVVCAMIYSISKRKSENDEKVQIMSDIQIAGESRFRRLGREFALAVISALFVAAMILYVFTQNMHLPMVMFDFWTILHVTLFAIQIVACKLISGKESIKNTRQAL